MWGGAAATPRVFYKKSLDNGQKDVYNQLSAKKLNKFLRGATLAVPLVFYLKAGGTLEFLLP